MRFKAGEPFVSEGQQIAAFKVLLPNAAGGNLRNQSLQQSDGALHCFRSISERASIRRTSFRSGLLGKRFSNFCCFAVDRGVMLRL